MFVCERMELWQNFSINVITVNKIEYLHALRALLLLTSHNPTVVLLHLLPKNFVCVGFMVIFAIGNSSDSVSNSIIILMLKLKLMNLHVWVSHSILRQGCVQILRIIYFYVCQCITKITISIASSCGICFSIQTLGKLIFLHEPKTFQQNIKWARKHFQWMRCQWLLRKLYQQISWYNSLLLLWCLLFIYYASSFSLEEYCW